MVQILLLLLSSGASGVIGEFMTQRFLTTSIPQSSICLEPKIIAYSEVHCSVSCKANKKEFQCMAFAFNETTLSCQCGWAKSPKELTQENVVDLQVPNMKVNSMCIQGKKLPLPCVISY